MIRRERDVSRPSKRPQPPRDLHPRRPDRWEQPTDMALLAAEDSSQRLVRVPPRVRSRRRTVLIYMCRRRTPGRQQAIAALAAVPQNAFFLTF